MPAAANDPELLMNPADQTPTTPSDVALREEARRWFVLLLEQPGATKQAEFEIWLRSDPANFAAYSAIEANWQASEQAGRRLAEKEAAQLSVYLEAMDKAKSRKITARRLSALSVLLACLLAGGWWLERPHIVQDMLADYSSARAERRNIALADGSSIILDADSALDVDYTTGERRVHLLRGRAYFDVEPSTVPFIVEAAKGEVTVLGTAFSVALMESGGLVTLQRGSVAVTVEEKAAKSTLVPGEQVKFSTGGIDAVETVNVDDAMAWQKGRFVFYRMRLADVIDEIQRYRKGRIVIASSRLAEETVTGSVSLADTDAALASLQASLGFRLHTVAGRLAILGP